MVLNYPVLFRTMDIRAEATISQAIQTAITDAESLWAPEKFDGVFPTKGFGIKRLQPRDMAGANGVPGTSIWGGASVGIVTWNLSCAVASAWGNVISAAQLSDSAYLIITGVFNYDTVPDVEAIKINADGIEYAIMDLQEMIGWDIATAYLSHPIVIRPQKTFTVSMRARSAGPKYFGFLGYTLAKRSYLIGQI
jgi:hypothetical protein